MNNVRIGQMYLPAVGKDHFHIQHTALRLCKLDACRGQRIECRYLIAAALYQNKGIIIGVICRCCFIEKIIAGHIGIGACL